MMFLSFSCERRGCCSSCGASRICNSAAVVADHVLPEVPVRQWVLSTPFEVRLLLARNSEAFGLPDDFEVVVLRIGLLRLNILLPNLIGHIPA